jgi:hypothetical protein
MIAVAVVAAESCGQAGTGTEGESVVRLSSALVVPATFNFVKTADWGSGYNARVDITNPGPGVIQGWSIGFDMPKNVQVNVSGGLPACSATQTDNCWFVFNDVGVENDVRVLHTTSNNVIAVGQTVSVYLYGSYEGVFAPPTRCRAPALDAPVACNGSTDATAPTAPSNVRIFGTGSTLVDLVWDPATDAVGVTGYGISYATTGAPALEIGEVPATTPVTRARITRLVSQTAYAFFVTARDAAGNVSTVASSPITTTGTPGISVTFNTTNTWQGGGFQGELHVTNNESVPLDDWRFSFSFTGSFQSLWNGVLSGGAGGNFTVTAPAYNLTLDPGEVAVVGATGLFGNPATPPGGFTVAAGDPAVRALATPQPPCLGLVCPAGLQCAVLPSGIPTCVP